MGAGRKKELSNSSEELPNSLPELANSFGELPNSLEELGNSFEELPNSSVDSGAAQSVSPRLRKTASKPFFVRTWQAMFG